MRIEDFAGYPALDRVPPWDNVLEEFKPLIGVHSARHTNLPDIGVWTAATKNHALADAAENAKTELIWGDVEGRGHRR